MTDARRALIPLQDKYLRNAYTIPSTKYRLRPSSIFRTTAHEYELRLKCEHHSRIYSPPPLPSLTSCTQQPNPTPSFFLSYLSLFHSLLYISVGTIEHNNFSSDVPGSDVHVVRTFRYKCPRGHKWPICY